MRTDGIVASQHRASSLTASPPLAIARPATPVSVVEADLSLCPFEQRSGLPAAMKMAPRRKNAATTYIPRSLQPGPTRWSPANESATPPTSHVQNTACTRMLTATFIHHADGLPSDILFSRPTSHSSAVSTRRVEREKQGYQPAGRSPLRVESWGVGSAPDARHDRLTL